jgi:hypothetical protein
MTEPPYEELKVKLADLEAIQQRGSTMSFKVSGKVGVSAEGVTQSVTIPPSYVLVHFSYEGREAHNGEHINGCNDNDEDPVGRPNGGENRYHQETGSIVSGNFG